MAQTAGAKSNAHFKVEINGIQEAEFSSVSGLNDETSAIEYNSGADPITRILPSGRTKYGPVTLKGAMKVSTEIDAWRKRIRDGEEDRRDVQITLTTPKGEKIRAWKLTDAWPSKYERGDLDAKSTDVMTWTLELQCEGIEDA